MTFKRGFDRSCKTSLATTWLFAVFWHRVCLRKPVVGTHWDGWEEGIVHLWASQRYLDDHCGKQDAGLDRPCSDPAGPFLRSEELIILSFPLFFLLKGVLGSVAGRESDLF